MRPQPPPNSSVPLGKLSQISESGPEAPKLSFKIVVVGESFVGKTSLIQKFVKEDYSTEYSVTVGVDFSCRSVRIFDSLVQLQIWDTCGHDLYRSVTTSFYRGACGVFLVFALNDRKSFQQLQYWHDEFKGNGSPNALVILIGTKSDQPHVISTEEGLGMMKKMGGLFYVETSAQTGSQIDELFNRTAELMYKNYKISHQFRELAEPRKHHSSIIIGAEEEQAGDGTATGWRAWRSKCC